MPVYKCNGKWKIGRHGECKFESKEAAENAFKHWIETQNGQIDGQYVVLGNVTIDVDVAMSWYGQKLTEVELSIPFEDSEYDDD